MPLVEVETIGVAVLGDEGYVGAAGGMGCEIFYCRVCGFDPSESLLGVVHQICADRILVCLPVPIVCELRRVVDIHLDQVFVERIRAASPTTRGVRKLTSFDIDVCTQQTRERLSGCWLRVQEIGLSLLRKFPINLFPSEIRETGPLKDKRTDRGNPVARISRGIGVEVEVIIGNTGGGVEGKGEPDC